MNTNKDWRDDFYEVEMYVQVEYSSNNHTRVHNMNMKLIDEVILCTYTAICSILSAVALICLFIL